MIVPRGVGGHKLLNFAGRLDDNVIEHANRLALVPCVHPYVVLLPNAQGGEVWAVGIVVPTTDTVVPAAIGVDMGCGTLAVRTTHTAESIAEASVPTLREAIDRAILPTSEGAIRAGGWTEGTVTRIETLRDLARPDDEGDWRTRRAVDLSHSLDWREHLGSLRGGDHFIGLSLDERDRVWLLLRAGSGDVGAKIARKHTEVAQKYCTIWPANLRAGNLPYLVNGSVEFIEYMRDVNWAQRFAFERRAEMMDRFLRLFADWVGAGIDSRRPGLGIDVERIDCPHEYVVRERLAERDVWVARNGAIDARAGRLGIISDLAGHRAFIVAGKGDTVGLCSAPHGASGRPSPTHACRRRSADEPTARTEQCDDEQWEDDFRGVEDLVDIRHTLRHVLFVDGT